MERFCPECGTPLCYLEDEGGTVQGDQIQLAADRGGPGVAGDDPHSPAPERVRRQCLGGSAQSLASVRHRGPP